MKALVLATAMAAGVVLAAGAQTSITSQRPAPPTPMPSPGQPATPSMPARDRAAAKGTAIVRGQVVDAASGGPIRRARVSLFFGREPIAAQTDAEGRFELRDVPAGKHNLNAGKTGYLSLSATNGNKPLPPLVVRDGDVIERVVVRLARGGVISGQVLDEFGDPYPGAEVRAMRYRYIRGQRQLAPTGAPGPLFTDDLGGFRIYGLDPGEYYVVARGGRDLMMGPTAAGDGPAQTYYPGTNNPADARSIAVRAGRESQGIVFSIATARLARVRGRVVTSTGEPFRGGVTVVSRDAPSGFFGGGGTSMQQDGNFEVSSLQPGTYTLVARHIDSFPPSAESEMGRVVVTVDGNEVNDVVIVTTPGGTARGRIVADDGSPLGAIARGFSLFVQPVDADTGGMLRAPSDVKPDGTFEVRGLFDRVHLGASPNGPPASTTTASSGTPTVWTVKAVLVEGQDVTDSGFEVRPGHVADNVQVVFTRQVSRISGRLRDGRGEQAAGWIVVFPSDEAKWTPLSRYVRVTRPDPGGEYRLMLTPHDDYLVVAVDGIEDGQWQDREFLRAVKELATRFSIGENESKAQDVTLVDWRR